jgi:RNA-binding protein
VRRVIELRKQARNLDPIIRIGKNGLTEGVLNQIKLALEKRKLIKIKFLKSYEESVDDAATKIASELHCTLINKIGKVVVLAK